jgi:hypothetical protein
LLQHDIHTYLHQNVHITDLRDPVGQICLMQRKIKSLILIETNYFVTRSEVFIAYETYVRHKQLIAYMLLANNSELMNGIAHIFQ